jgi:hypothetical protein
VNLGGEPERDDFGLPPVDIEIPDDARELDRDVQAYRREQRALQRRLRGGRLLGPLTRGGTVMPLLAGCLVFALIAAVLLTLFTATSGDINSPKVVSTGPKAPATGPQAAATGPQAAAPSHAAVATALRSGQKLPNQTIKVGGRDQSLRTLTPAVLALVPLKCGCTSALQQLISQAAHAQVRLYLVATDSGIAQLRGIAASGTSFRPTVADDHRNVLGTTYHPEGLTAILASVDGSVRLASKLKPGLNLTAGFRSLALNASPGT